MWGLRAWRRRRTLARHPLPDPLWHEAWARLPILHRLSREEAENLRELTTLFLREKTLEAAGGLKLLPAMGVAIAAQACLPILKLGLDWYDGWSAVIVYPAEFVPTVEWTDEAGVVHVGEEVRSGEAWQHGPVILSWEDVAGSGWGGGYNVVLHEFAHKLDALDGSVDGRPPLHREMDPTAWSEVFGAAFAAMNAQLDLGEQTVLDPYAAEAPEEFFAVLSEAFFETPALLQQAFPAVYAQLQAFYRQDPAGV